MRRVFSSYFYSMCASLMCSAVLLAGEGSLQAPNALENIDVLDRVGNRLPSSLKATNHLGEDVDLGKIIANSKRPTVMTLGYFACPMLCSLVLNGLVEGLRGMTTFELGKDYQIVSVSINPKDTVKVAKAKQANYLESLGKSDVSLPWTFYVSTPDEVEKLAQAVGFQFRYDSKIDQYAHGAAVFFISPQGVLTRTLWGINFAPSDIKKALMEAANGTIGSPIERILLSCFHYVPDSRQYGIYVFGVMRLGGALTIIGLLVFLGFYWRLERSKSGSKR